MYLLSRYGLVAKERQACFYFTAVAQARQSRTMGWCCVGTLSSVTHTPLLPTAPKANVVQPTESIVDIWMEMEGCNFVPYGIFGRKC